MRKVILYIRVSTAGQAEKGYSIGEQKDRLLAYAKAKGWAVVDIIIDGGFSGSDLKRPGIQKIMEIAGEKGVDIVCVNKLDRLSRSQKDTLHLIEDIFLPNGVDFVSVQESFDTSTPMGKFQLSILSAFAQLEREQIRDRTFGGRVERSKTGLWHGGGVDPIGYRYIDGFLTIDKEESHQVRKVFELYAAGHNIKFISEQMAGYQTKHGGWQHSGTISDVLDNPLYAGYVHFDGNLTPGVHDAIISKDLYHVVKKIREKRKQASSTMNENNKYSILSGLVYCKNCGARYFPRKYTSGNTHYCCYSRAKVNKKMVKDPSCRNDGIPGDELIADVEKKVKEFIDNPMLIHDMIAQKKVLRKEDSDGSHRGEIEEIDRQIGRLLDAYQLDQDGKPYEEISHRLSMLYEKKEHLLAKVENITEKGTVSAFFIDSIKLRLNDTKHLWDGSDIHYRRFVMDDLIDKIEVDHGELIYHWSFI